MYMKYNYCDMFLFPKYVRLFLYISLKKENKNTCWTPLRLLNYLKQSYVFKSKVLGQSKNRAWCPRSIVKNVQNILSQKSFGKPEIPAWKNRVPNRGSYFNKIVFSANRLDISTLLLLITGKFHQSEKKICL